MTMLKSSKNNRKASVAMTTCLALMFAAASASASSAYFTLAPGVANPAAGDGTPYSWSHRGIYQWWANPDGFVPVPQTDGSTAWEAYLTLQGTDVSSNGHCLEISFTPGTAFYHADFVMVDVKVNGNWVLLNASNLEGNDTYGPTRIWINHTSGPSLYWSVQLMAPLGGSYPANQGGPYANDGDFYMTLWRFEANKAGCTTGSGRPWVSFEGSTAATTITYHHF